MYTACLNYGKNYGEVNKGHRANGFTTDGGFARVSVNHINTLVHVADTMSATRRRPSSSLRARRCTASTSSAALIAGESMVVTGPGPIGLMGVAVAKALGAHPVILTGTRDNRLEIGKKLGADHVVNIRNEDPVEAVRRLTDGKGVHYVLECSARPRRINEAAQMVNRGGEICLAAFPHAGRSRSTSPTSSATTSTFTASAAKARAAIHRAEAFMVARNVSMPS